MFNQLNKRNVLWIITMVLMSLLISSGCSRRENFPSNLGNYDRTGSFRIDPDTIISSLNHGDANVFTTVLSTDSQNNSLLPPGYVAWTQPEFLEIASALHEHVWNESIDNWNIYYLAFDRICRDQVIGFDRAEFTLFKEASTEYELHRIEILPLASVVDWGGDTTYPRSFFEKWDKIELNQYNISAGEALLIAEAFGGKEVRQADGNDCRTLVRIPNSKSDIRWEVSYYFTHPFEILVNPYSGEHQIPEL